MLLCFFTARFRSVVVSYCSTRSLLVLAGVNRLLRNKAARHRHTRKNNNTLHALSLRLYVFLFGIIIIVVAARHGYSLTDIPIYKYVVVRSFLIITAHSTQRGILRNPTTRSCSLVCTHRKETEEVTSYNLIHAGGRLSAQ